MAVAAVPRVDPSSASLVGAGNFWLRVLARPKTGVPIAEAKARLASVWPAIAERTIPADWPADRRKALADATFEFAAGGTGYTYSQCLRQQTRTRSEEDTSELQSPDHIVWRLL